MAVKKDEIKYYGLHACLSIWKHRPQDIIRVYIHKMQMPVCGALLKWCSENKKSYRIVKEEELEKLCKSAHHQGLCVLAKPASVLSIAELVKLLAEQSKQNKKQCLLYLDALENPHNIGSILRTCAHFGVRFIIFGESNGGVIPASACRVAVGGAELLQQVVSLNPHKDIQLLKKLGFSLLATSSHQGKSLYTHNFKAKTIITLGSEDKGISKNILALAEEVLMIPGTGEIESLNVSVASALILGEYYRQIYHQ